MTRRKKIRNAQKKNRKLWKKDPGSMWAALVLLLGSSRFARMKWRIIFLLAYVLCVSSGVFADDEMFSTAAPMLFAVGFLDAAPPATSQVGWTSANEITNWSTYLAEADTIVDVSTSAGLTSALSAVNASQKTYIRIGDAVGSVTSWKNFTTSVDMSAGKWCVIGPQGITSGRSDRAVTFGSTTVTPFLNIRHDRYIFGGFNFVAYDGQVFTVESCADTIITDLYCDNVGKYTTNGEAWEVNNGGVNGRIHHVYWTNLKNSGRFNVDVAGGDTIPSGWRVDHCTAEGILHSAESGLDRGFSHCQMGQAEQYYNNLSDPSDNGGQWNLYCTYEYNYVVVSTGDGAYGEQPSVKSSSNIIRYNFFGGPLGVGKLRNAHRCEFYGNYYSGINNDSSSPIDISGSDHHVYCNIIDLTTGVVDRAIATVIGGHRSNNNPYPPCVDCIIEHNTVINPNGKADRATLHPNYDPGSLSTNITGVTRDIWRNNIVICNTGTYSTAKSEYDTSPASPVSLTMTNNIAYGTASLGNALTNYGSGTITTNPDLDANYAPNPGSPAIGAGTTNGITYDFYGNTYDSPPDIGAVSTYVAPSGDSNILNHTSTSASASAARSATIWTEPWVFRIWRFMFA